MHLEKRLYNSRIILAFINLLKKRYGYVDVYELLQAAGMTRYQISDEGHWFTQKQVDLFYEKMTEMVGGKDLAREAGRFSASGESLGLMSKYLLGMIGPANTFAAINKSVAHFAKSSTYSSRKINENSVEIVVTPLEGAEEKPYQCENRQGYLEAVLMMFNYSVPVIEHPECVFEGGSCCRYIVTWEKTRYNWLKTITKYGTAFALVLALGLAPFVSFTSLYCILSAVVIFLLGSSYVSERMEISELCEGLANLKETSDSLLDEVSNNYNNARMVNDVGHAISMQGGIDDVLGNVIKALQNRVLYDRCVILLADEEKKSLVFRGGFGYTDHQLELLKNSSFNVSNPGSKGVFVVCFREQRPIFVNDFAELTHSHSPRSVELSEKMEASAFLCCAIVCEGESLGVLAVDNIKTKKKMTQSDMDLLMGIAPAIGVSIRNAMYLERETRMADQMRQSQKMEAVGQLAGGIAHDFNNLITAVIGFATLTRMNMSDEDPSRKYVDQVLFAADRAANLTQGLLAFSRKQENDPKPEDLNWIVENIRKLLSRLISAEIDLVISLSPERLNVVADAGQIEQVMMNLVTNARDAMNGAGKLTIATAEMEMPEETVKALGYGAAGSYAVLSVTDTGTGMDERTKAHIFEPFFTTKEVGKGTGLGLAVVYGIVQQHEGFVEIDSELGVGTTFRIFLPLRRKEAVKPVPEGKMKLVNGGTETVLVAEDAPEVRRLTAEVLTRSGYQVIEAIDGRDAVDKFTEHGKEIDLVIMDVVMPKMNGNDAYTAISKINPRMKVLFTSGYRPDDVRDKGIAFGKKNFLPKPSSPQVLLEKVREVLAA